MLKPTKVAPVIAAKKIDKPFKLIKDKFKKKGPKKVNFLPDMDSL